MKPQLAIIRKSSKLHGEGNATTCYISRLKFIGRGLGTRDTSGNLKPCLNIETRKRYGCLPPILNFYDEFFKSYEKGAWQGQGEVMGT